MATSDDHRLAAELAMRAGVLLLELRLRLSAEGAPAATLRDEGDRAAHDLLMDALAEARPDDAVLSEEGSAHEVHPDRAEASRVWIVDPLDGTREFSEPPRPDWAVHVALAEDGHPTAGAVALPGLGLTLSTLEANTTDDLAPVPGVPRIVVSRTRPPAKALEVAEALGRRAIEADVAGRPRVDPRYVRALHLASDSPQLAVRHRQQDVGLARVEHVARRTMEAPSADLEVARRERGH